MLLFTLLEHTTAKPFFEMPFPTVIGPPVRISSALFRHPGSSTCRGGGLSSLFTLFASGAGPGASSEEDDDEEAPSPSESSEKGCMGGGGGRGATTAFGFEGFLLFSAVPDDDAEDEADDDVGNPILDFTRGARATGAEGAAGRAAMVVPVLIPLLLLCSRALFISACGSGLSPAKIFFSFLFINRDLQRDTTFFFWGR